MTTIKQPLVSVIVPVYNVETYIDACLNSIKQQTYKNLEIIIVEDCSTDNSRQMLDSHLIDERIKLIQHSENGGLSAARNTGIESATGEYMMFVDSDDIVSENLVQACINSAMELSADVVLYQVKPFQDGELIESLPKPASESRVSKIIKQLDYFKYPHFAWLKFMRTDLVRDKNLQFHIGQYYEDWPFHWEVGFTASKIIEISDGYYYYRQRGDSITGSGDQKLLHIFSSHCLVTNIIDKYDASEDIRAVLANKICRGTWFVLTTIDDRYLKEAVVNAKQHLKKMSKHRIYSSPALKIRVLISALKLPTSSALISIRSLRLALNKLSSARRHK